MTCQTILSLFKLATIRPIQLLLIAALLAVFIPSFGHAAEYRIARAPSWVNPLEFSAMADVPTENISSGVYYLLSEFQTKVAKSGDVSTFYHSAIKVVNSSGIKDVSQVSVDFDPEYEQVTLHLIRVHRGQSHTDQLSPEKINILQRESQLEYQIYDGTRSLNVILDDVRIGDVVEYSYTTDGYNPVYDGHYFSSISTVWGVPVHRVQNRLLWPADRRLFIKNHNSDLQPVVNERSGYREYLWGQENVPPILTDSNTPAWYDPYGWIQLSDMGDWEEVIRWARKLYRAPERISPELETLISEIQATYSDDAQRITAVLRFIQDEVRYMGIEIGPQSHAPSDPSDVLSRRFGDCKDKTLLGLTMLHRLGIDAAPALVNSRIGETIETRLPTPTAFNHVILKVVSGGNVYWLDPTISLQRGHLKQIYQPDYGNALVISEENKGLERMVVPGNLNVTKFVQDTFDLRQGVGKGALYTVKTVYTAQSSDFTRRQFANNSRQQLQKSYLDFYADSYPSIRLDKEMEIEDDEIKNCITVTERYLIPEIWEEEGDSNRLRVNFVPEDLKSYFSAPDSPIRTMPFAIGHPIHVRQKTLVYLPEEWDVEVGQEQVDDPAFLFDSDVSYNAMELTLDYHYQSRKDSVAIDDVPAFQKHIDQASNLAWYYISATDPTATASIAVVEPPIEEVGVNWPTILLAILVFLLSVAVAVLLYLYDPSVGHESSSSQAPKGIGGWLVLVAIGIVLQPFILLIGNFDLKWIFFLNEWSVLTTPGTDSYHALWAPTLIFELSLNIALVVFAAVLALLFFQKRSSLPKVFVLFRISVILFLVLDTLLASFIPAVAAQPGGNDHSELIRQTIFGLIWIAYFLKSERVKATFVCRRAGKSGVVQKVDQIVQADAWICPKCSTSVVARVATKGAHEGKSFKVCSAYPKCKYVEPLKV